MVLGICNCDFLAILDICSSETSQDTVLGICNCDFLAILGIRSSETFQVLGYFRQRNASLAGASIEKLLRLTPKPKVKLLAPRDRAIIIESAMLL